MWAYPALRTANTTKVQGIYLASGIVSSGHTWNGVWPHKTTWGGGGQLPYSPSIEHIASWLNNVTFYGLAFCQLCHAHKKIHQALPAFMIVVWRSLGTTLIITSTCK